jgi:hypothetical protein
MSKDKQEKIVKHKDLVKHKKQQDSFEIIDIIMYSILALLYLNHDHENAVRFYKYVGLVYLLGSIIKLTQL